MEESLGKSLRPDSKPDEKYMVEFEMPGGGRRLALSSEEAKSLGEQGGRAVVSDAERVEKNHEFFPKADKQTRME